MLGFFLYVTLVKCEIPSNDIYISKFYSPSLREIFVECQENEEFTRCPGFEINCVDERQVDLQIYYFRKIHNFSHVHHFLVI